ncbi:MAG: hypothetical protein U9M95_04895 [Candidatus Altiarchaeota archaeon]|nr:hypothetical protein [Candidatus Altiarchaeota archaeon]
MQFKVNVNIGRSHAYGIVLVLVLCSLAVYVFSQGGPVQGHPAEEISPGTFQGDGDYVFPLTADVGVGTDPTCRLHIKATGVGGSSEKTLCIDGGDIFYIDSSPTIQFINRNKLKYWRISSYGGVFRFYYTDDKGASWTKKLSIHPDKLNVSDDLLVEGDIHCTGKLTSDGGNDPPYVLFNRECPESIKERIDKEIPKDEVIKYDGQAIFYDGDRDNMFLLNPKTGELREFVWREDLDNLQKEFNKLKEIVCENNPGADICEMVAGI